MQLKHPLTGVIILLMTLCAHIGVAQSDLPPPPYAQITYSDGSSVLVPGSGRTFPLVGVQANQPVQVTVQLAPSYALQTFTIEALDGGVALPPTSAVPTDPRNFINCTTVPCAQRISTDDMAKLAFAFVPGSTPGSYRLVLRKGGIAMVLEFWVLSPDPQNNPPVITPETPNS